MAHMDNEGMQKKCGGYTFRLHMRPQANNLERAQPYVLRSRRGSGSVKLQFVPFPWGGTHILGGNPTDSTS